jgi:hypothetical protein
MLIICCVVLMDGSALYLQFWIVIYVALMPCIANVLTFLGVIYSQYKFYSNI